MSKRNLRSIGRVLAGLACVAGLTLATGCSGSKCCGKDGCCKQTAKKCPANCDKPCCSKS